MVEVNVSELRSKIEEVSGLIGTFSLDEVNIFNKLNDVNNYWNDPSSLRFIEKIDSEKSESNQIISYLNSEMNNYKLIADKYASIGNTIKCNVNNKDYVLSVIDSSINSVTSAINTFSYIEQCDEFYWIMEQRDRLYGVLNQLRDCRSKVENMFNRIREIEREVYDKVKSNQSISISSFDFEL